MRNLGEKFQELEARKLKVGTSRGVLAVQQTERNAIKVELIEAFYKDLEEMCEKYDMMAYRTAEGPIVELMNDSVDDQVARQDDEGLCTGRVCFEFDIKIKNLDFDAETEQRAYLATVEEKQVKAKDDAKAKADKIKRDAEMRAEKKRLRDEKLAELASKEAK